MGVGVGPEFPDFSTDVVPHIDPANTPVPGDVDLAVDGIVVNPLHAVLVVDLVGIKGPEHEAESGGRDSPDQIMMDEDVGGAGIHPDSPSPAPLMIVIAAGHVCVHPVVGDFHPLQVTVVI